LWAVRGGGTGDDYLHGVAVDAAGAVVAAGYSYDFPVTFGGVVLISTDTIYDAILWKVSAEGTTLWAVRGGGGYGDTVKGVAVDGAGAVVAAGSFASSPATFGGVVLTRYFGDDALLWKLSAEGTTLWAVRGGGSNHDFLNGVAVDGAGAVVAAGSFQSVTATFGGVALTSAGTNDAIMWKVDDEGTTPWAVRGGGTGDDYMYGVAVDGADDVVAVGCFESSSATFGGVALTNAGGDGDAILWKMNAEGTTLWAVRGGGTGNHMLRGVAVDGTGGVVAVGYFSSSPATFGGVVLANAAGDDALLWKVSAEGTTLWGVRGGGGNHDYLNGVAVDGAGAVVAAGNFQSVMATFGGVALSGDGGDPVVWKVSGLLRRLLHLFHHNRFDSQKPFPHLF